MIWLVAGLVLFLGIHSVRMIAPQFRDNVIATRGEGAWKGLYSIVSIAGFVVLVWGYGQARVSPDNAFFYSSPTWMLHLQLLLMLPAMILLFASQFPTGRIKKTVKNPMLIGVKIWAIGHLLVNGDLASLLLFGVFLIWAVLLVINTNRRGEAMPESVSTLGDVLSVVVGVAAWAAFTFWLHEWLIGVPAIA